MSVAIPKKEYVRLKKSSAVDRALVAKITKGL